MPAIAVSADGDNIFIAAEDSSGNPLVVKAARSDLSTWSAVYEPAAGSTSNVAAVPGNPDLMMFYGNFGTDVTVIKHTISTVANTDISPASLGAKVVNTLEVNPSDEDEIVITIDTDQDLEHTSDGGTTWTEWNNALGFDATALDVLWSGTYFLHRLFVAGDNGTDLDLLYSPNEGANTSNEEDATLGGKTNICNVETTQA